MKSYIWCGCGNHSRVGDLSSQDEGLSSCSITFTKIHVWLYIWLVLALEEYYTHAHTKTHKIYMWYIYIYIWNWKMGGLWPCCGPIWVPCLCIAQKKDKVQIFRREKGRDFHKLWWTDERQGLSTRLRESVSEARSLGLSSHLLCISQSLANIEDKIVVPV